MVRIVSKLVPIMVRQRQQYIELLEAAHLACWGVCDWKGSSSLTTKNSPQDCFFNVALRVSVGA